MQSGDAARAILSVTELKSKAVVTWRLQVGNAGSDSPEAAVELLQTAPFQAHFLTSLGPKKPGQVTRQERRIDF